MMSSNNRSVDSPMDDDFAATDQPDLELSDYLMFDGWPEDDLAAATSSNMAFSGYVDPNPVLLQANEVAQFAGSSNHPQGHISSRDSRNSQEKKERFAFKTKSEVEILDDGFKWRKYGKKMVKNSPNPRNYYRCSVDGCPVKKRVERDRDDTRYVITTYEGIHTHQSPF